MVQAMSSMAALRGVSQQAVLESGHTMTVGVVAQKALTNARSIKLDDPPLPSGGKPRTLLSDEARDLELPLKERFYIQPLSADQVTMRSRESAKQILEVKKLIDKKASPYVQNDLHSKASYLHYDLNTVISSKPKEEKKPLKTLTTKLF